MPGIYLHEIIDITGQGAVPYMEHTANFHAETAADRGLTLLGTWYVVGATGRWPQVVNLWEMVDGWEGWRRLVRSTNLRRTENVELSEWWDEAYRHRRGGVDRLLEAVAGSPDLATLQAQGVHGELFVHELSAVQPGTAGEYLEAVIDEWAPVAAERGHRLVGAYEVLMTDTEVVTVWATDLDRHVDAMVRRHDPEVVAWRERAREWLVDGREELMVPHAGTPLAPPT